MNSPGRYWRANGGGGLDPVNWEFVVRFGEGSQVGLSIVTSTSAIPEPSSWCCWVGGSNDGWACRGSAQIQAGVIWTSPVRLFGNGNEPREFPRSCKIVIAAGSGGGYASATPHISVSKDPA
jgi:hypothetical protein